jgi:hypothetical protein
MVHVAKAKFDLLILPRSEDRGNKLVGFSNE